MVRLTRQVVDGNLRDVKVGDAGIGHAQVHLLGPVLGDGVMRPRITAVDAVVRGTPLPVDFEDQTV